MAYKVLIVDDEEMMTEGLANFVDWKSMGFEVAAKLKDGQEAIDYINIQPVEVILSDVKMTFVSGLDLAKYVFESKLNIKVVLISAYREFEFAQKAISYNVSHYLLKPVMFKDVSDVFVQIKAQLDREKENKKLEIQKNNKIDELLMLSRRQFFTDVVMGAFINEAEVLQKIEILNFEINIINSKCCMLSISITHFDSFINNGWDYTKEGLYNAIRNFFGIGRHSMQYFDISTRSNEMRFVVMQTVIDNANFELELKNQLEEIQLGIKALLGLEINIGVISIFDDIVKMAISCSDKMTDTRQNENGTLDYMGEEVNLVEQQKLIFSHILNSELEIALSLLKRYFEGLKCYGHIMLQKSTIDLFTLLTSKLRENGIDFMNSDNELFNSVQIMQCKNVNDIMSLCEQTFENISKLVGGQAKKGERDVIVRIKYYISEHFDRDITLDDVGNYVFLTPVYLSRMFKEQTGENFSEYIIKVKMEKAAEFLRNPKYKVYDVSRMVGYNSIKHFYRIFKRYKGCTPTEYRSNTL